MRWQATIFVLAATCVAASAAAEPTPTEAEKDAARILFTEGKELRDAGKLVPALERFARAHELAATPITTLELARTHAMLGHLVEARKFYRAVDAMEHKPGESSKAIAARDEAKQLALELDGRIPTLIVKVRPEGETLVAASIDGKAIETSLLTTPLALDPGKHVIAVRAKTEGSVTVIANEGEHDRVVTIDLPAATPPPPPPPPDLPRPETPPNSGGAWTSVRWPAAVVGGLGLIVGAGAGALALSSASTVKNNCGGGICPPSRHDDLDATRRWATVSTIGFGVAAVGATLFVISLISAPSKKEVASPSVVPYASLGSLGGGFGLTGRF